MLLVILAAAVATASSPAPAKTPVAPKPPTSYKIEASDNDLRLFDFVVQTNGSRCSSTTEEFCRAQILLNDMSRRWKAQIDAQIDAQKEPAK